jgi:hypothetical protein
MFFVAFVIFLIYQFAHENPATPFGRRPATGRAQRSGRTGNQPAHRDADVDQSAVPRAGGSAEQSLAHHDFFYAGEAKNERLFLVRRGEIVWSY